ncbi:hypothetical protein AB1N83_014014, partial [Pleurotus pulmonarius]
TGGSTPWTSSTAK